MKAPMKRRDFTLSIKHDIPQFIEQVKQCPEYAYILHSKDTNHATGEQIETHCHAYIAFPNPRSFKSVAQLLNVPEHMVCKIIDKKSIIQYLIHKNHSDKYQYDFSEITSNFTLEPYFMDNSSHLWRDYNSLRSGQLTPDDFYQLHKHSIDANNFYQKLRIFEMITFTGSNSQLPPLNAPIPPIHKLIKH